jgi:hypothetical protein
MSPIMEEFTLYAGLFAAMAVALEVGFHAGRSLRKTEAGDGGAHVGAIQGAVLGLLGLLLAFSFAAAGTRFMERQDLIVQEANAIGTAYLRAELLAEPRRSELRSALQGYTEHRIAASRRLTRGLDPAVQAESEGMHVRIWSAARDGVAARPELAVAILTPVNEVIDLHSTRVNAARKHIPWLVLTLLVACSLLAVATIGYSCGVDGRRRLPLTLSLALLVGCALGITVDLDHPRRGVLRLSDAPLQELKFDPR